MVTDDHGTPTLSVFAAATEAKGSRQSTSRVLRYDVNQLRRETIESLDGFGEWAQSERIRSLVGAQRLRELAAGLSQIRERLKGQFSLVVLGDFKRGKSTLINALLRAEVTTTNITPETLTVNEIGFGPEFRVSAFLADGRTIELSRADLTAERLSPLLEKLLPGSVDHLEITAPVDWLEGMRLVDTPGTGDLTERLEGRLSSYLPEADAVIYVVSALAPLSQTEQAFLRSVVAPQEFPKLLFVVNMMDIAQTDEEAARLLSATREKLARIFPGASLFGLSALAEIRRIENHAQPNADRAGALGADFDAFREQLREMILLNRDVIRLDRAGALLQILTRNFGDQVALLRRGVQVEHASLEEALAACEAHTAHISDAEEQAKADIRAAMASFAEETSLWLEGFVDRLQLEVVNQVSHFDPDDVQQHFQFFLSDVLGQAMDQCVQRQRPAVLESLSVAENSLSEDFRDVLDLGLGGSESGSLPAGAVFGDVAWDIFDTGSLLLHRGRLGVLGIVAELFVQRAQASRRASAQQKRLDVVLPELKDALSAQTRVLYQTFADRITGELTSHYSRDVETSLATLRRASSLSQVSQHQVEAMAPVFDEILAHIEETCRVVDATRGKLWSEGTVMSDVQGASGDDQVS